MKISVLHIILFAFLSYSSIAQQVVLTDEVRQSLKDTPKESLWLQTNNTSFFPSEYLYFNLYTLNTSTQKASDLSKVVYVRLVSSDGDNALEKRVALNNGFGQGDLFIPPTLKTGSYQIQAYTAWMLNEPQSIFTQEIFIINPYTNAKVNAANTEELTSNNKPTKLGEFNSIAIEVAKQYKKRDSIELRIRIMNEANLSSFPYSVSVRKIDTIPHPIRNQIWNSKSVQNTSIKDSIWLPEHRGGTIRAQVNSDFFDAKSAVISQRGTDRLVLRLTEENSNTISIQSPKANSDFSVLIQDQGNYSIEDLIKFNSLPKPKKQVYPSSFKSIDQHFKTAIIKRSLYNQIENSYFEFKPDSIILNPNTSFLKSLNSVEFNLNEYTRFATLKETIREIIPEVSVTTIQGKEVIRVKQIRMMPRFENALLLVDGIVFANTQQLFDIAATMIDKIRVYTEPFVLGGKTYAGALIMTGNDPEAPYFNKAVNVPQTHLTESPKSYFNQLHKSYSNLPDYRTQLYWNPRLSPSEFQNIQLFSSDISGRFEVRVQGLDSNLKPFSVVKEFEVN